MSSILECVCVFTSLMLGAHSPTVVLHSVKCNSLIQDDLVETLFAVEWSQQSLNSCGLASPSCPFDFSCDQKLARCSCKSELDTRSFHIHCSVYIYSVLTENADVQTVMIKQCILTSLSIIKAFLIQDMSEKKLQMALVKKQEKKNKRHCTKWLTSWILQIQA